ncbi:hypothetical protein TIFTF001_034367 [Ficus carica]|uniref:Uncharacterized protein n=1 Tax=Ficus carica TaxID=3494 RepID=A0AA88J8R6_FICCA|nr:hypothetical protein TIFTF001_034367 [Ficus carica]
MDLGWGFAGWVGVLSTDFGGAGGGFHCRTAGRRTGGGDLSGPTTTSEDDVGGGVGVGRIKVVEGLGGPIDGGVGHCGSAD